jgi:hypothetical protein
MEMIRLKNGSEEPKPVVHVTMISLKEMWQSGIPGMLAVSDLVQICRGDPTYKPSGDKENQLKQLSLLQEDGRPHDSVRNVVLSAFTGKGLDLQMTSPVAAE